MTSLHELSLKPWDLKSLFKEDEKRGEKYFLSACHLHLDYSKNLLDDEVLAELFSLAREKGLSEYIKDMFSGKAINTTEQRSVLHTALRGKNPVFVNGADLMKGVEGVKTRLYEFANKVRSGAWLGHLGDKIKNIVNIGIGGSDLGCLMSVTALKDFVSKDLNFYFVSNVDYAALADVLEGLDPKNTLFIVASKTFTTQETLTNAMSAREWFLKSGASEKDIAKHFVALSTNEVAVQKFGIDKANMFEFWDWVGGRYSIYSAIGLSLILAIGPKQFEEFLEGARAMDEHFKSAEFEVNMPVILALISVFNFNYLRLQSQVICPYDEHLKHLPRFLQQLDMESNGKGRNKEGKRVKTSTGPIIWGDTGINAQHAFFQLLHQGTSVNPIDFIASLRPFDENKDNEEHRKILLANLIAQAQAFMLGKSKKEAQQEMREAGMSKDEAKRLAPFRAFDGNRPSNVIFMDKLDPFALGALIALYEHKVFVQGVIWGINSFDQFGVELGKALAKGVLKCMEGEISKEMDSSTRHLIRLFKEAKC